MLWLTIGNFRGDANYTRESESASERATFLEFTRHIFTNFIYFCENFEWENSTEIGS